MRATLMIVTILIAAQTHGVLSQTRSTYDGVWNITRSFAPGCAEMGTGFSISIQGGTVSAPGGNGTIATDGRFRFPGVANQFSGKLSGSKGNGRYTGQCTGTFTARRA